jgi:hypothetical protein
MDDIHLRVNSQWTPAYESLQSPTAMKKTVSEKTLMARINRKLKNESLRKTRSNCKWRDDLGDYYQVNTLLNTITAQRIDLNKFARKMGALAEFEEIAD